MGEAMAAFEAMLMARASEPSQAITVRSTENILAEVVDCHQ